MSAAGSASGGQVSKVSHFRRRALPSRAEVRAAVADSVLLAVACLISYWLTTVVLVVAGLSPHEAWRQPILRLADTAIGVAVGLVAAWLGLRAIRPRIRPPESPLAKPLGEFAS